MRAACETLEAAGLKPPADRVATGKLWVALFGGLSDEELTAAAVAHILDPERGNWWPKPADIMRHVHAERGLERSRMAAIESRQGQALVIEDIQTRSAERQAQRERERLHRLACEQRDREHAAAEQQALADGQVYGPVMQRLGRYSAARIVALGTCEAPRGEHLHWHQSQSMDACPYRSTLQIRGRSTLHAIDGGIADEIDIVTDGVARRQ